MRRLARLAAAGLAVLLILSHASAVFADDNEVVPPPSRDVTPPGMTPGPVGDGPLIREKVPPPPADPARWRRFFLAVAVDAGTFNLGKRPAKLAGLTAPAAAETCKLVSGEAWNCGTAAVWALRRFLRGRAVDCYFATRDPDPLTVPCRVGASDIGLWLLGQGWAKPADGASDDYRKAAEAAHCAGLGLWRDDKAAGSCPK